MSQLPNMGCCPLELRSCRRGQKSTLRNGLGKLWSIMSRNLCHRAQQEQKAQYRPTPKTGTGHATCQLKTFFLEQKQPSLPRVPIRAFIPCNLKCLQPKWFVPWTTF